MVVVSRQTSNKRLLEASEHGLYCKVRRSFTCRSGSIPERQWLCGATPHIPVPLRPQGPGGSQPQPRAALISGSLQVKLHTELEDSPEHYHADRRRARSLSIWAVLSTYISSDLTNHSVQSQFLSGQSTHNPSICSTIQRMVAAVLWVRTQTESVAWFSIGTSESPTST